MEILVNWDECEGNGLCMGIAPELFHLDDDDVLHLVESHPPAELEGRALLAAGTCPKAAISIIR